MTAFCGTPSRRKVASAEAGFTLLEALTALALTGLIVGAIAVVSGQWLPGWRRPAQAAQRSEQIAIAIDRIAADLAAAQWTTLGNGFALFRGGPSEAIFIRSALGPNGAAGLEIVRLAEIAGEDGIMLVRDRAPFAPLREDALQRVSFTNPVIVLRPPLRANFVFGGSDGRWSESWYDLGVLPSVIRFTIRDETRGEGVTAASRILANAPAPRPGAPLLEDMVQAGAKP